MSEQRKPGIGGEGGEGLTASGQAADRLGAKTLEFAIAPEARDTYEEVLELERAYTALEYIRGCYALKGMTPRQRALAPIESPMHYVEQIGNQFAKKILPAYMHEDADTGLALFREVVPHTTQEEMVLGVQDEQFRDIHEGVAECLEETAPEMEKAVKERLDPETGQMARNDRLQFRATETGSSLENVLRNGISLSVEPQAIEDLQRLAERTNSGSIPMTELAKNLRMIAIGAFTGSKISHAVHDVMDHAWTFDLLKEKGLLEDYADLFQSIGNPHQTNVFFREGEAVASIAFGSRYWSIIEPGFKPIISSTDLAAQMDEHFDNGRLTDERHLRAYKIMRKLAKDPNTREAQSLGFAFSNYFTELDEQRRKHGKIKQKDLITGRVTNELDPLSPDFLSLFIETHHAILSSENNHRRDLLVFHIVLEEYLRDIGMGVIAAEQPLNIRVQDLRTRDVSQTELPPERLHWLFRNYGFTSTKDSIY